MEEKGRLVACIFNSKETNYTIARIETEKGYLTICGYLPPLDDSSLYLFKGEYVTHPKYGEQFKVSTCERIMDNSREGIINYLSSDLFEGIGPKTAEMIYDVLGPSCIDEILKDEQVLEKVGLSKKRIAKLYEALVRNQGMQNVLIDLYGYGVSAKMALKLYETYGMDTVRLIEEDPYRLIKEVPGYSFVKADELAYNMGFSADNNKRIKAGIIFVLDNVAKNYGYTYLTKIQLIDTSYEYLMKREYFNKKIIIDELENLISEEELIEEDECVYLRISYFAELELGKKIKKISSMPNRFYNKNVVDEAIKIIEKKSGIIYSFNQKKAIIEAISNPITIITGGPGTGKTTVIEGIIRLYFLLNPDEKLESVSLMAPTGRAAKRMFEQTNHAAKTIHRSLGYDFNNEFAYNISNQLPYKLIIVDEVSMIDVYLAKNLFDAININTQVVLVGDANQIPSVAPGMVLEDLIKSEKICSISLDIIHRQKQGSSIIDLSKKVLEGNVDYSFFQNKDDLSFILCEQNNTKELISSKVSEMINKGFSLINDIQILIPMYKGIVGIDEVNKLIQERFNPSKEEISYKDKRFKVGDKILQLQNNPLKDVMNGDIGFVTEIVKGQFDDETTYLKVSYDLVTVLYKKEEFDEITLAYAISIHKSQGSEYPVVILPVLRSYYVMLKKKLLYTAITRAKNELLILGDFNAFSYGINALDDSRQTSLQKRLSEKINKRINIPGIPFEFFGEEDMENITPYSFMEEENNN